MAVTTCPRQLAEYYGDVRACLEELRPRRFWSALMKAPETVRPVEATLPEKAGEAVEGLGNAEYIVIDAGGSVHSPFRRVTRKGYIVVIPHLVKTARSPEDARRLAEEAFKYARGVDDLVKEWKISMGGVLVYRKPDGTYIIAPGVIVRERNRGIWLGYRWCVANPVSLHRYEIMDLEKYLPEHCGTEKPITRIENEMRLG